MSRTTGTATTGITLALVGTLSLAASMLNLGIGWVPLAVGMILLGGGLILVVAGLRKPEPVLTIPPAHVTFYQQIRRDLPIPHAPVRQEPASSLEPMDPEDLEISLLDVQIREVSRKINKATVMLGTGKISDEGYRRYVEDLKIEKADLEARRVKLEMARTD